MTASINTFISALRSPSDYFTTLRDITVECNAMGSVEVSRTKYFADVVIMIGERRYLLSMPLSSEAFEMAERASSRIRALRSQILLEYRLLPSELEYMGTNGRVMSCDLLLEELPHQGMLLSELLTIHRHQVDAAELFGAIDELEQELKRLKIVNPNLKADNIMVGEGGALYPIRLHYITLLDSVGDEFAALREEVAQMLGTEIIMRDSSLGGAAHLGAYQTLHQTAHQAGLNALNGYLWVGNPFEGLSVVESAAGYGYIDSSGREVIEPQYIWAGDICEGRARVQSTEGWGLIDARGTYIIEPRYQHLEFDIQTGYTQAILGGKRSMFDYNGVLLSTEDIEASEYSRTALEDVELEA